MKKRIMEKCVNILIALVAVGVAAGMVVRVATIVIGCLIIMAKSYEKNINRMILFRKQSMKR